MHRARSDVRSATSITARLDPQEHLGKGVLVGLKIS